MRKISIACLVVAIASSQGARAQSVVDKTTAQALFDAAKELMEEGKVAESCPKFAESQRLDPAPGTLLNLADCYEKQNLTASAWATWLEASVACRAVGQTPRERMARARADALKPRLVGLTIMAPEGSSSVALEIRRDGSPVGMATWGTWVPVDPGSHAITASAPGYRTWQETVDVVEGSAPVVVTVPVLQLEQAAPPPVLARPWIPPPVVSVNASPNQPVESDASHSGVSQRTWAFVTGGVGIVGLGVGTYFGLKAKSKNDDSKDECRTDTRCTQAGLNLRDKALDAATYSTVGFGVGLAALTAGIILYVTAPQDNKTAGTPRWGLHANASPTSSELAIAGEF
jgi:hypothetical protein